MLDFEKIENEFYLLRYGIKSNENNGVYNEANKTSELWDKIKEHRELLKWAIQITQNKWKNGDILNGPAISDAILIDYKNINQNIYNELIEYIYTNKEIARTKLYGAFCVKGSYSFLLMSLWNHNLKLTDEQKAFAVSEAMAEDTQAHFGGAFDIRYQILRNPNWSLDEKQKLIMDFYNDEEYDEVIEEWELSIMNDNANYQGNEFLPFDRYELLNEWTYESLLEFYENKETTDRIWSEIEFCKQMHKLRPQEWELDTTSPKI